MSHQATAPTTRAPARILVVDDNPVNCELLEAMLLPEGYEVEQAHSGAEALSSAAQRRPDMVLLDVNMPRMDGFEVARRLRSNAATRTLPVVMVTALGDLDHRVQGMESGADDFLTKPVSQAELLARVQSSLRLSWLRRQVDERRKLELVLGDVSDGIVIVDVQGRVVEASPSARRFLQFNDGDARIDAVWGDLQGLPSDVAGAVAAGRPLDFTVRREQPPLFVRVGMRPVHDPQGKATGAVLSLRDVTRETMDHKIQQDVLSLVSHKFRTPLTVVHSWTGVLLDEGCGALAPEQRGALQAIAASTDQLRTLLDGILAYVEWTQRVQRAQVERVDMGSLSRELRQRVCSELGGETNFTVEHDDAHVEVDVGLFVDALLELVRNARKFGDEDTQVRVIMRRDDEGVRVEVIDDGPGIPPEHLESIFQRFFQVESDFTGQVHGLGLGLSRVQRAVEAIGARLDVSSKLDQGTHFSIRF